MLNLEILTIDRKVFEGKVNSVVVPTRSGVIEIFEKHEPLISAIAHGELRIKTGKSQDSLAISGGFVHVSTDKTSILADLAERIEEIDEEKALKARNQAQETMKRKDIPKEEYAQAAIMLRKAITRLQIVRKRKTKRGFAADSSTKLSPPD